MELPMEAPMRRVVSEAAVLLCFSCDPAVALRQPCFGAVQKVVLYVDLLRAGECG